jgi:hypothetical protein
MHNFRFALEGAWQVLLAGLVLGAGLPTLFAVGVRSMAYGTGGSAEVDNGAAPHPAGRVIGVICFAVVLLGIALGITFVIASGFGKELNFEHIYPTIKDK